MHNPFDQLAKQIGQEALGPSGTTVVHDEIVPEILHADLRHEPDPARKGERKRLGLLGRIAAGLCLIEIYGHAPSAAEFRACLAKHIAFWQKWTRNAKKQRGNRRRSQASVAPVLWIIAAGTPTTILSELKLKPAHGWPAGVCFFGAGILRVGIVVASKLPPSPSTLLVRLMAAGPLLEPAIKQLMSLRLTAPERVVAEPILLRLESALKRKPKPDRKEKEFIVAMYKTWEERRIEARTEGLAEGRAEGRAAAQANAVLTALRVRGIAVPEAARKRILAQKDLQRLERWLEKAIVASSLREVIDDRPSKTAKSVAHKERNGRRSARVAVSR